MNTFLNLGIEKHLLNAINDLGFETPSEIQQKTIPKLLSTECDLVALAQTGTGKTAAFGFPMLQKIDVKSRTTQGLILSPTRELCLQITNELKLYGKYCNGLNVTAIYGGASITDQAKNIKRGSQIIVATPGRMKDMISRRLVDISKIDYAVLDEADEMLNMGFFEDIKSILSHTPENKSTWLFSATMPKEVSLIAKKFMFSPTEITVGHKNTGSKNVSHEFYMVASRDRYPALKRLADANPEIFAVIFCRTKRETQKVAEKLIEDGYNAGALHGDLSQNQRDLVMKSFRNKQIQMLVATDVAARGIDVDDITHVINYQLPDEIETYTHRSGRTGRAGKNGISIVIITKSEARKIKAIEKIIQKQFEKKEIPDGIQICEIQLKSLAQKIHKTEVNQEIENYLEEINKLFENLTKEEIIKKFFSVEFSRFFNYYAKAKNLNSPNDLKSAERYNSNSIRFFINIGKKDGFDWMSLKDFLRDSLELGQDDIFKVDVKDSFSFFNSETKNLAKILEFFKDYEINGRFVNVEITDNKERGKQKRSRKRRGEKRKNESNSKRRNSNNIKSQKKDFKGSRPRRNRRK
jgi:ATP-dependent RNA helicase DeaD